MIICQLPKSRAVLQGLCSFQRRARLQGVDWLKKFLELQSVQFLTGENELYTKNRFSPKHVEYWSPSALQTKMMIAAFSGINSFPEEAILIYLSVWKITRRQDF